MEYDRSNAIKSIVLSILIIGLLAFIFIYNTSFFNINHNSNNNNKNSNNNNNNNSNNNNNNNNNSNNNNNNNNNSNNNSNNRNTVINVDGISLNITKTELVVGDIINLEVTITPSNATNKKVKWSSSNNAIATVDNGKVITKNSGDVIITVTSEDNNKKATCSIKVNKLKEESITITFISDGKTYSSSTITRGSKVSKPTNPVKSGYTFKEWQLNGKTFDFNTSITNNISLTALWEKNKETIKPILNDGTINNNYWNIKKNKKSKEDAINTRNGINKAISYANKNGIKNIKLEKGNYYIDITTKVTVNNKGYHTGIRMLNNVNLNLNGSTIYVISNNLNTSSIVLFTSVKNSSISNGKIVGDRDIHEYSTTNNHAHGMGINIFSKSNNITIDNIDISSVTGDAIYISNDNGSLKASKISKNSKHSINITNSNIHYFRRNGISIISGNDIYIYNNKIHDCVYHSSSTGYDKHSVSPRAAIDLERNNINQMYSNIFIINNQLYDVYGATTHIEDNILNFDFENNKISKHITFALDSNKAYKASGDYTKTDYSSFKVCNTMNDFIKNTSSTIANNILIDKNLVIKSTEKYYDSSLNQNNIYYSVPFIDDIKVKVDSKTIQKGKNNVVLKYSNYITITPSNAHNKKMYWTIEDESIMTWGNIKNPIESPRINTIKKGETYLVGRTIDGSNKTIKIKIIVTE